MNLPDSVVKVQQLLFQGRAEEAVSLLQSEAGKGNGEALYTLATWRIDGRIVRRDLHIARDLMAKAADVGHLKAALLHAHFTANGTGGSADFKSGRTLLESICEVVPEAAQQLEMLSKMNVDEHGAPGTPPSLIQISEAPAIYSATSFLNPEECQYLISKAGPRLQPSMVTDRATGRSIPHPVRRSEGTFFGVASEDLVVGAINRRIASISATTLDQAEPLQVLRYGPGGEFRPHFDSVKEGGNQRILTAIVYLSDDYQGGETKFLRAGLSFRGGKGELLLFSNVTSDGRPDPLTEHAGLPVRSGTKLIASRWIWRERPTLPSPTPVVDET